MSAQVGTGKANSSDPSKMRQPLLNQVLVRNLLISFTAKLKQLATFVSFLKFQTEHSPVALLTPETFRLYQDFAEEDRQLAQMGMTDYVMGLAQEDSL